jgi:predicted lipid-binding transport protein (Tim44 family)
MRAGGGGVGATANRDEIGIGPDDYQAFEQLLGHIQMAWSVNDQRALARLTTPEMLGYFTEELDRMAAAGLVNHQEDGKLLQGDLAEAWSEGARQYATVAMRWTARDWVEDRSGRVVEGNRDMAQERTEVWTFVRVQGQAWVLSAVQPV